MRWTRRSIGLSLIAALVVYFAVAAWLRASFVDPTPDGDVVVLLDRPFERVGDFGAVSYKIRSNQAFQDSADITGAGKRSPALLYEEKRLLGPAHSDVQDIARLGKGRFLHSQRGFIFSASDNSDPNMNGRHYWAVLPRKGVDNAKR